MANGEVDDLDPGGAGSRRDLLKKAGAGAALAWTTPVAMSWTHAAAAASPVPGTAYRLTISGPDENIPVFRLENTSFSSGALITRLHFTIGDTAFEFDQAYASSDTPPAAGTASLVQPDNAQNGARTDELEWTYTGFHAGEFHRFTVDVDRDNSNTVVDYRTVFFNNGGAPNSVITVTFDNGTILSQTIPDQTPGQATYAFTQGS